MQIFLLLCGSENWSVALSDERGLRMFENRVLRKAFGLKSDCVRGKCRRLHKELIQDLYSSSNKIRVIKSRRRWAGNVARKGDRRSAYRVQAVKSDGNRLLGRPRRRWEKNIKLIFGKWNGNTYTGFIRFRTGQMAASCDLG